MATKPESTTDSSVNNVIILEAIFQIARVNNGGDRPVQELVIDVYTEQFDGDDYQLTVRKAEKKLKKILKEGLELRSKAIIKSVIAPSAILQIGLIDLNKYQEEASKLNEIVDNIENGFAEKVKAAAAQE